MILRNAVWCDIPRNMGRHTSSVAFSTPKFRYCLFLAEHTRYRLLLHCISHCLLWLVSNPFLVGSWMELVFLVLLSKRKVGWLCLSWPTRTPVNLWTKGTLGRQFAFVGPVWSLREEHHLCHCQYHCHFEQNLLSYDECASDSILIKVPWSMVCNIYPV